MNELFTLHGRTFPLWFWIVSFVTIPVFLWLMFRWITDFIELTVTVFSHSYQKEVCRETTRPFELEILVSGLNGSGMQTHVIFLLTGDELHEDLEKEAFAEEIEAEMERIAQSVLKLKNEDQVDFQLGSNEKLVLSNIAHKYGCQMTDAQCLVE